MSKTVETDFYPAANEKGVVGRFEWFNQLDVAASREADSEKYKKILTLRARAVGSSDDSVVPVREFNRARLIARFPEAWAAFQNIEDAAPATGTPLVDIDMEEEWIIRLKLVGVRTVEQLAIISDGAVGNLGFGARSWRDKAQHYLDAAREAGLQRAVAAADKPKRKPGRPKKQDAAIPTAA